MLVRIGTVTDIYPEEGKVRVLYSDLEDTSTKLPTMANEYNMPAVGATVLVLYTENDSNGFVLGEFWNKVKRPSENDAAVYKKEFGEGYMRAEGKGFTLFSPDLIFKGDAGEITLAQIIELMDRVSALEQK